jgi:putative ABC transport system permease protein
MENFFQDVRYGLRGFGSTPAFTLIVVLTLALGIGATTAVFSVADLALFRGLPYPHQERLVSVGMVAPIEHGEFMLGTDYLEWRSHQTAFEAFTSMMPNLADCDITEQNPARLSCALVESTFLPTFGVEPVIGRNFSHDEDQPDAPKVALLSYATWRGRYGADPGIVGKTISVDSQPTRIVGILPANFEFPTLAHADLLMPQALPEAKQLRPNPGRVLRAFARLKPDVTIAQAEAALQPLMEESLKWVPPQFRKEVSLRVRSLRDRQIGDARLAFWILLAAVTAVLLIACANVAGLLMARGATRQRELAVRAALGATRSRLVRQALTESLLLGLSGGVAGCVLAQLLLRLFVAIAPEGIPRLQDARLDLRALSFALLISMVSGIVFGLVPAFQVPRLEDLTGRIVIGFSGNRFRQFLAGAQIAVSLVLLAGASLLLRSLWNLERQPLGLRSESVMTANVTLGKNYAQPAQQLAFFDRMEEKLRRLPGVTAVGLTDSLPPGGPQHFTLFAAIRVDGRPLPAEGTGGQVAWRSVTPGYFTALGIPILRGRGFLDEDRNPTAYSVILSDALARLMFPGENPIGQRLQPGLDGPWFTVIGVAADVKNNGLDVAANPEFYYTRRRTPEDAWSSSVAIMRTPMDPKGMAAWVRSQVAELDPNLPVSIESMGQHVSKFAERPRFDAALLGLFAVIGVVLAGTGIYGVISFLISQRTQEIGVRMALGARPGDIVHWVAGNGITPMTLGAGVGLIGGLAASRVLTSLLFGVQPHDPLTFGVAAVVVVLIGLLASYIPARRAVKVDPMMALRTQ